MKKIAIIILLLSAAASAPAQDQLTYFLPSTTVTLDVEAVRETSFAGPYASYAKKYLGIDVRMKDETRTYLSSVSLEVATEADPAARYAIDPGKQSDRLLALSSQGLICLGKDVSAESVRWQFAAPERSDFLRKGVSSGEVKERRTTYKNVVVDSTGVLTQVPVYQDVMVSRTLEQRAKEAADLILKVRQERYKITVGDTDATYSGEALGAAIAELTRMEEEYMTLFVGYTVKEPQFASFEVRPSAGRPQSYPAFRISPGNGLLSPDEGEGELYTLDFSPEQASEPAEDNPKKKSSKLKSRGVRYVHYRIPAICTVSLVSGGDLFLMTRIPVWQLGEELKYPITK